MSILEDPCCPSVNSGVELANVEYCKSWVQYDQLPAGGLYFESVQLECFTECDCQMGWCGCKYVETTMTSILPTLAGATSRMRRNVALSRVTNTTKPVEQLHVETKCQPEFIGRSCRIRKL